MYKAIFLSCILFIFAWRTHAQCSAGFSVTVREDSVYLQAVKTGTDIHYLWSFGDGAGLSTTASTALHIYTSPGLYNITLYLYDSLTNCYDSVTKQASVQFADSCDADFTIIQDTINTRTYNFIPEGYAAGNGTHYYWSIQNTSYGNDSNGILRHTFPDSGYYNVCLEVYTPDSCYSKICKTVYIPVSDSCSIDASFVAVIKSDTLRATAIGNTQGVVHTWHFGDGNQLSGVSLDTIQHIYSAPGNYSLLHTLRDTLNQCIDSVWQAVTIVNNDSCSVDFTISKDTTGYIFAFINRDNPNNVLSYNWTIDTVQSSADDTLYKVFTVPGTYTVCLKVIYKNGCMAIVCKNVTVLPDSVCNITAGFTDSVATNNPLKVFFRAQQTYTQAGYWWSFGDGNFTDSSVYNPVHQYPAAGTYLVQLLVMDTVSNCADTIARYITVNALPDSLSSGRSYIQSYPNPSAERNIKMNLVLDRAEEIIITIYNTQGTVMLTRKKSGITGSNNIELDVSGLRKGQYFIDIRYGNQRKRSVFLRL